MKIRAALISVTLLVTSLIAAPAHAARSLTVGVVYDIGGKGDLSFNDAAAAGLVLAQKKFDFALDAIVTDGTSADREKRVRTLAEKGCNPIIVVGSGFAPALQLMAIEYPEVQFAILNDASVPALNVTSLIFKEKQGAYLAGFAAALVSRSKKVAMIATPSQADIYKDGFSAGVLAAKKSVKPYIKYVSGSAVVAAKQLMEIGSDVIFVTRAGSDNDVFGAIVAHNKSKSSNVGLISVSPDQYVTVTSATKKYLLASVVKRVDIAMYDVIAHAYADNEVPDILDEEAGIFGHTYGIGKGIEFRTYSSLLSSQSAAINQAAASALKITH
jgi:basic membrane protein A